MSETEGTPDSRTVKGCLFSMQPARVIIQIAALAAAFGLGVSVGLSHRQLAEVPRAWTGQADKRSDDTHPGALQHKSEALKGAPEVEELLTQLDLHLRRLIAQRRQLESAAKEDRIAYNLMRMRGYSDDSVECQRLINRQKHLDDKAVQFDARITEARQLQGRLHEILDAAGVAQPDGGASDQLFAEIQWCLSRSHHASWNENAIPNERWSGGPDLLMKASQPNHGHNLDAGANHE